MKPGHSIGRSSLILAALFWCCFTSVCHSQKKTNIGTEFYVAFAHNLGGNNTPADDDSNFFALFISSRTPTSGTVEVAGLGWTKSFTTTPGAVTTIELPDGKHPGDQSVECLTSEQVLRGMAVHITSADPITVYGFSHKLWSSDGFLALPVPALGTEYRTLNYRTSWEQGKIGSPGNTPSEFWIAAANDSTTVTITPTAATFSGKAAGVPFSVVLNTGDVYLVQGDLSDTTNDLTGSLVRSDKPIAVLSGHVRADIPSGFIDLGGTNPSRDHICEQLPPVSTWGDSALVVRYATSSLPDLVRIVSADDNNTITVNGTIVANLNAGQFYEIGQLTEPVSIQGTSPILVGQYMHTSQYSGKKAYGDPAYALVYPVEQFDTAYTFLLYENVYAYAANFVNIVADPDGISGMMLDGVPITGAPYNAQFSPIPNSRYEYAQISLSQGSHTIYGPKHFGITVYALGFIDSYSYPGGTQLRTITPLKLASNIIDFGDRLLTPPGPPYGGVKNEWDTTVAMQNISSDPFRIASFQTQGGNGSTNYSALAPATPTTVKAGAIDSLTIRFAPDQADVRLHTKLMAQTSGGRSYLVDVYGRGILANPQVFTDSEATIHCDTLDFGVLQPADPPKDSFVFVMNKGIADLTISSDAIAGPDATDFSIKSRSIGGAAVTTPYTLRPYNKITEKDSSATMIITFTPNAPNGTKQAFLDINTLVGKRRVVLLARVRTILQSSATAAAFDSTFLCTSQTKSIVVDNPNDFPVKVLSVSIAGANPGDYSVLTPLPIVVPDSGSSEIRVQFAPSAVGASTATANLLFDLPNGFVQAIPLSGTGDQIGVTLAARNDIHVLPGDNVRFPIYALSPMEVFNSPSFQLTLTYDPSHLEYTGFEQSNTLTAAGHYDVVSDTIGSERFVYRTQDGSAVSGGAPGDERPLIVINFRSRLAAGENALAFHLQDTVQYSVDFDRSPVPSACAASATPEGVIYLDSTCANVSLIRDTILSPTVAAIEPITPNPIFDSHAHFGIDVSEEGQVRLEVVDILGNRVATLLDEFRKPGRYGLEWDASAYPAGTYYVRLDTGGQVKFRQLHLIR